MKTIITLCLGICIGAAGISIGQMSDERYTDTGLTPQESTAFQEFERDRMWAEDPIVREKDPC